MNDRAVARPYHCRGFSMNSRGDAFRVWIRRATSSGLVWAVMTAFASPVYAQASDDATKTEARDHFDRGLRLFNQLDNEGALAEFLRAYELIPHQAVLQNIGIVYAAMGRPVQAQEAFDRLLANPTGLNAATIDKIQSERARQLSQIAELDLIANVPGGLIEVDGVEAGRTPLARSIRVAKGNHIVSVIATGYIPLRKPLNLAGGAKTQVVFELLPTEAQVAHIDVRSRIPKLDLYLDGEFVGQTPLPASLAVAPGLHQFEAKRLGYRTATQSANLGPGSSGALDLNPEVDANSLNVEGGELALAISEPGAILFVDGESRGAYSVPVRLVAGDHWLRVERAEFLPVERKVTVVARGRSEYAVELKPTSEKLENYRSAVTRRSTWGWVATGAGSVLVGGDIGFLLWNSKQKSNKKAAFETQVARANPGGDCDPKGIQQSTCGTELQLALQNLDNARRRDVYGWVGLGVGAVAFGTGLYLLLGNDDGQRYAPKPQSDVFGRLRWAPTAWVDARGAGTGVIGTF